MGSVIDDGTVTAGLSWNGFNLQGDIRSIAEVRRLFNVEERLRWFEFAYRELLDAGCPCKTIVRKHVPATQSEMV